jgi:hypothetical protein
MPEVGAGVQVQEATVGERFKSSVADLCAVFVLFVRERERRSFSIEMSSPSTWRVALNMAGWDR